MSFQVVVSSTSSREFSEPSSFNISNIELSEKVRTISGRITKDITGVKKKISINFDTLDSDDFNFLRSLYESLEVFTFVYNEAGRIIEMDMIIENFSHDLFKSDFNYATGVSFDLEEV